jgi:hypothetical protein
VATSPYFSVIDPPSLKWSQFLDSKFRPPQPPRFPRNARSSNPVHIKWPWEKERHHDQSIRGYAKIKRNELCLTSFPIHVPVCPPDVPSMNFTPALFLGKSFPSMGLCDDEAVGCLPITTRSSTYVSLLRVSYLYGRESARMPSLSCTIPGFGRLSAQNEEE